jgi:hypothetical protein
MGPKPRAPANPTIARQRTHNQSSQRDRVFEHYADLQTEATASYFDKGWRAPATIFAALRHQAFAPLTAYAECPLN